jgi:hypothetical protein
MKRHINLHYQVMVKCSNSVGLIWSRYHTITDSIGQKCGWGCQFKVGHCHAVSSMGLSMDNNIKTTALGTGNPRRVISTRVFCFSDLEIGLIWSRFDSTLHKGDHIFCLCEEALTDSNCQFY